MKTLIFGAMLTLVFCASCDKNDDDDNNNNNINQTDKDFARVASMSNFAEIDAGQLAITNATDAGVQDFAQMMVTDHSAGKQQLQTIAGSLNLYAPDSLDAEHVALKTLLNSLSGESFDSAYIVNQKMDHQAAITLFENESANGNNSQLRTFAAEKLPTLRLHLHHADSLSAVFE